MPQQLLHALLSLLKPNNECYHIRATLGSGLFVNGMHQSAQRLQGVHDTYIVLMTQGFNAVDEEAVDVLPDKAKLFRGYLLHLGLQLAHLRLQQEELVPERVLVLANVFAPEQRLVDLHHLLLEEPLRARAAAPSRRHVHSCPKTASALQRGDL